MKKKFKCKGRCFGLGNFRSMKFFVLFMLLAVFQVNAEVRSQETFLSIKKTNATLIDILKTIEAQSGYTCLYSYSDVAKVANLTVELKNVPVQDVLEVCLKDTKLGYKIVDQTIIIRNLTELEQKKDEVKKKSITGKVTDSKKEPLPGVTILVKGTTIGVVTDVEGNYKITLPDQKEISLLFSFIGMVSQEIKVTNQTEINVVLEEDVENLEEVVVNGIFTRKASSFTGSIVSVTKEKLLQVSNQNVFQSLKNLDPSLMIFDNMDYGSDPNRNPKMQLRGTSSFNLSGGEVDLKGTYGTDPNAPLFILDGFEATVQKIMDLDMNRVESLTILKDASAKAIYGSKAANGVIVIETKKTTDGELRVSYTGSVDLSIPDLSSYHLTNAAQKLEVEKDAGLYDGDKYDPTGLPKKYNRILSAVLAGVDTDWLAKPLRTGVGTKHTLSVELGSNDLRVIADLSYNNIQGVMKGSERVNTAGSLMVSYRHKKFNFRNILTVTSNVSNDSPYGQFSEYARLNPYWSPYDENGLLSQNIALQFIDDKDKETSDEFVANPLYNASLNTLLRQEYIDVTNNAYIEWMIKPGLKATGRFGITEKRTKADEFYPANHLKFKSYSDDDYFRRGSYQINEGDNKTLTGDLNVNWSKEWGKHFVFGNLGYTLSENTFEEDIYNAEGFPNDKMNNIIFAKQYTKDMKPTGVESTTRDMGFLGVANYAYDNRILVDGSYRASASSQFGSNSRWGQFWSVGMGWNIHNERWMKDRWEHLNMLKLRGSVGYTGSQSSEAYASIASYKYFMDQTYDQFLGAYLKGMKNDDLKWQEKLDYNIGIDVDIAHNFTLKFDYYISQTTNTLLDFTIPPSTGFTSVKENIGDVKNTGFDAYLTYTPWRNVKDRSFFTLTAAVSHNKNKITGISDAMKQYNKKQDEIASDRFDNRPVQKYYEGVSMTAIWAVKSLGIDPATGEEIFLSKDGKRTNSWSAADMVICGDELPDFSGNFGFNYTWKGLSLNCVFRYQFGGQMYNQTLVDLVENADLNYNVDKRVYDGRWRNPGDIKPYKALKYVNVQKPGTNEWESKMIKTQATSRFVQDRNDLTLSSVNLSYDMMNHDFINKIGLKVLRFSFYMNDVYTWSSIRVERGTSYPFARSFNFSLSATF